MSAQEDADATWNSLKDGIERMMNRLEEGLSYEQYMRLYTDVYNHCTLSKTNSVGLNARGATLGGGLLYDHLRVYLREHLTGVRDASEGHLDDALLQYYVKEWRRFTTASTYVNHVFRYVNRHWVRREVEEGHRNVYDVYTLCLISWRDHFFMAARTGIMDAVLNMIKRHRDGESVDTGLLKSISSSFTMLGLDENDTTRKTLDIYKKYFEEPFLQNTKTYYQDESERFLSKHSVVDYMRKAEVRLKEEEARVNMYLDESTMKPLISCCETALVASHRDVLVEEFQVLLNNDKVDDLARTFFLLARINNGLVQLKEKLESHVRQTGNVAVEKLDGEADVDPKAYVDALLDVYKKYYTLVVGAFKNDAGFMGSLDRACRDYVNRNALCKTSSSRSPEYLARYSDFLLKKSSKNAEDSELESYLNDIMLVFKYIEDRDVFQKFYSKMLAKRLVYDSSTSEDAEASMISKLKEACGFEYTSKLSRMFTDMTVSKDLNDSFRERVLQHHDAAEFGHVDFYIKVLATGSWPLQPPSSPFNIPMELEKVYSRFQQFYSEQHSGRKLNWLFHLSHGELKTNYLKASKVGYTFQVYTYTMGILLHYNNTTSASLDELRSATGLSDDVLQGQLMNLCKAKVLEESNGRYDLNFNFKSKKIRVNLRMNVKSEQKQESDETHRTIEEDRKLLIQAAIVRIMKTRKTMKHVTLVQELINQVQSRFKPRITDIKKCIDILLEKEYIERVEGDKDTYAYLA